MWITTVSPYARESKTVLDSGFPHIQGTQRRFPPKYIDKFKVDRLQIILAAVSGYPEYF